MATSRAASGRCKADARQNHAAELLMAVMPITTAVRRKP
jgi:hypothetical protein